MILLSQQEDVKIQIIGRYIYVPMDAIFVIGMGSTSLWIPPILSATLRRGARLRAPEERFPHMIRRALVARRFLCSLM